MNRELPEVQAGFRKSRGTRNQIANIFWIIKKAREYKKNLHDPVNHDGVITHLDPDTLECKVKWVLRSITMNIASGGDGIPVESFQILKNDL